MRSVGIIIGAQLVSGLPLLVALVAGLVMATAGRRRLTGRARRFLLAGLLLLLFDFVLSATWPLLIEFTFDRRVASMDLILFAYGLASSLTLGVGVALLIAAVFVGRPAAPPAAPHPGAYPAYGPGGGQVDTDPYAPTPAPR
ncbi:hypothetical protein ACK8GG_15245 [Micromonosporaceae bacterium DT55]|uniref:hypothetical protein n=1 Tax=Melissospora conviva TaxID=3388432 RepID=UPI003C1A6B87